MAMDEDGGAALPSRKLTAARLASGLVQGLALYLLYSAADAKVWPASNGQAFAPLLFVALAAPLVFTLSVGNLRFRTLLLWLAGAGALAAFLGWYNIWHGWPVEWSGNAATPRIIPSFTVFLGTGAMLFIAHALIAGGDHDRRFRATYPTHFDLSWKLGVQLALALIFVVVFWGLLWLGAGLFGLVKLTFFQRLIEHRWFAIPVTALASAAALHVTDIRPSLVRGTRTLVLVLLSWLLPVMMAIAVAFLAALLFTGLTPLWQTRRAASLLMIAAAALIILINATYQDGKEERAPSRLFRYGASISALALLPLTLLAAYALALRVTQYGWTVDRIALFCCVAVGLAYAGGYTLAALRKGVWLHFLEVWNFAVALFVLAVLFAYFSPVGDPARISVASQMARLEAGKTAPAKFDFAYLRWNGGRFGAHALDKLSHWSGPNANIVRHQALAARDMRFEYWHALAAPDLAATITVYPAHTKLPADFVRQFTNAKITDYSLPSCLRMTQVHCDAFVLDLDDDGRAEIVIVPNDGLGNPVFAQEPDGSWKEVGKLDAGAKCAAVLQALKSGKYLLIPPAPQRFRDIEAGGQRVTVEPARQTSCLNK
jgi:hypothetical protein